MIGVEVVSFDLSDEQVLVDIYIDGVLALGSVDIVQEPQGSFDPSQLSDDNIMERALDLAMATAAFRKSEAQRIAAAHPIHLSVNGGLP